MTDDESRRIILSRRARFIAAALTSAGLAGSCDDSGSSAPQVCLSPPRGGHGGAGGDTGTDADADAGAPSDASNDSVEPPVDATDADA